MLTTKSTSLIFERIKMILMSVGINEEKINENRHLYDDLYFDSLSYLDFLVLIESYFQIVIEDAIAEKIYTIHQLQTIIQSKISLEK